MKRRVIAGLVALAALTAINPVRGESGLTTRRPPYDQGCLIETVVLGIRRACNEVLPGRHGIVSHTNLPVGEIASETLIAIDVPDGATVTATAHFRGGWPSMQGSTWICLQLQPLWSRTTPPATCERIPNVAILAWPVTLREADPGPGLWFVRAFIRAGFISYGQTVMRVEEISYTIA